MLFNGTREGNQLEGTWGNVPDCDVGSWKFTYVTPKSGWNGTYEQDGIEYDMDFKQLTIENGKLHANGKDENGPFEIAGTYDAAAQTVALKKTYDSGVFWDYWGSVNGNAIEGSWGDGG
jgi:hypothetical protein